MITPHVRLQTGDALIIADVQNDFLPGGKLAVPHGDEVVPVLNRYISLFDAQKLPIYAIRDWHPALHCSFLPQGGIWPPHCVQESQGAQFSSQLLLPRQVIIISKATEREFEAYSGFQGTSLASSLKQQCIQRLFIGGLATDYCVLNTVMDALTLQFQVFVLEDAIRAIDLQLGDGDRALQKMQSRGAVLITLQGVNT
jgi:nicotinamidase/pyrazinamidase